MIIISNEGQKIEARSYGNEAERHWITQMQQQQTNRNVLSEVWNLSKERHLAPHIVEHHNRLYDLEGASRPDNGHFLGYITSSLTLDHYNSQVVLPVVRSFVYPGMLFQQF
ncbi:hypothetical protein TNCT_308231 [Trichonephila clavata]|uniref:Uncharacterized protein n=1 Tax=Trichonephila clavata TaxID=2740835 RepID=A0A8X6IJA2_TRICU|nr:hypothetical protein TNCT_308231 [Trichonephila clavata]